jgi:hypothetical protein
MRHVAEMGGKRRIHLRSTAPHTTWVVTPRATWPAVTKDHSKLASVSIDRRLLEKHGLWIYVHLAERGNDFSTKLDGFPLRPSGNWNAKMSATRRPVKGTAWMTRESTPPKGRSRRLVENQASSTVVRIEPPPWGRTYQPYDQTQTFL